MYITCAHTCTHTHHTHSLLGAFEESIKICTHTHMRIHTCTHTHTSHTQPVGEESIKIGWAATLHVAMVTISDALVIGRLNIR